MYAVQDVKTKHNLEVEEHAWEMRSRALVCDHHVCK